jgi:hypothetical protein
MSKHEVDEFFCKKCKRSMVGPDGICLNCGNDTYAETEPRYEDEDQSLFDELESDQYE